MNKKRKMIIITSSILLVVAIAVGGIFIFKEAQDDEMKLNEKIIQRISEWNILSDQYALKLDDTIITPQVYQAYLIQKTLIAQGKVADGGANLMEQEIEGVPVPDWIEAEVQHQIVYDYVIKSEWDQLGENVSQSEQERLDIYLDQQWELNKDAYEINQCDRETFHAAHEGFLYNDLAFDDYSFKNPLTEEELQSSAQIASVKYFILNKYSLDGKKYTQEETDKLISLVEEYIKELNNQKSIDEIYKNYLVATGEDSSSYRPISTSIITNDNTEYTSKIPNFVNHLLEAKMDEPFYAEDEYYITIGIRQKDDDRKEVQQAYADNQVRKVQKEKFDEYIEGMMKNVKVERNQSIINKYSPDTIKMPESE